MTSSRDDFLLRVRDAVQVGNRPGAVSALESRCAIGYQGGGPDPVARFAAECATAGGIVHVVQDREAAVAKVVELLQARSARKVLVGSGPVIDGLALQERLSSLGLELHLVSDLTAETCREPFFAADVGVSGVDYLIAETGTIVLKARPEEPRSLSLLPPVHIAVAEREQLLPDLFDLFEAMCPQAANGAARPALPSCLTLITGPSKTGDIELRLVTGVHGPGEAHVVIISA